MYKLILVDDEEEVRKGVLEKIDWHKLGFEIVGEAENGKEALELAEKAIPDVVITDIKMPFMDGLALSKKLKEQFPTTKIIILTGFEEFEFAKKAIQLNVIEYVLKPISCDELTGVLVKVKQRLDEEIAQKEDLRSLKEHYRKSLPILREKFLSSLITSSLKKAEIFEKSNNYGLNLDGRNFIVSAISIDYHRSLLETNAEEARGEKKGELLVKAEDRDLMRFSVLNIAEEIVLKHNLGVIFLHQDNIVIISVPVEEQSDVIVDKTLQILEEIRISIEKYLKYTVTIGVGNVCLDLVYLNYSYLDAMTALDYRLILGKNRIIYIQDVEPQNLKRVVFDQLKEHGLVSCIKVGNTSEIKETIDDLFKEIHDAKVSFKDYQIYLLEVLTTILKAAKDLSVDMDLLFGANYNLLVEVYKFTDIKQLKEWIAGICVKIMSHISKDRQDSCKLLVEKAKEYIDEKYFDSEITIDHLCKMLHISPTYFSTIFKKETKLTFVSYLTQVRMDAAKKLLRTTGLKFFEIAEQVGYAEPNYFSYCFKKNFGISPSEYRNSA